MKRIFATRCSILFSFSLWLLAPAAYAQDDQNKGTGGSFEGWNQEGKDKPAGEQPANKDEPPKAQQQPGTAEKPAEVGAGANAPGSHTGLLPSVSTQYGSLTVLGVFQILLDNQFTLANPTNEGVYYTKQSFDFQRARIIVKGHVINENFTYFFQGDARNMLSFALDMYLGYKFGTSGLSFRVGRFVPEFSYMMPRNTADLAAINYPIYLTNGNFAVWRQIGVEASYQFNEELNIRLGVFNGMLYDPFSVKSADVYMQMGSYTFGTAPGVTYSNYSDNNKAKDFLLRASYKLNKTLSLDLNGWFGMPVNASDPGSNDFVFMGGPGAEYNDGKLHLVGEFMFRALSYGQDNGPEAVYSLGAWAHAGYRLSDWLEGIFRIDLLDPVISHNKNDMLMRFTVGPHFWLEEKHFRILANLYYDLPMEGDNRQHNLGIQIQFGALW
jgi:hypothetical protein